MSDLSRIVVPSVVVGALMMLVDVYATPWFSTLWWGLRPGQ